MRQRYYPLNNPESVSQNTFVKLMFFMIRFFLLQIVTKTYFFVTKYDNETYFINFDTPKIGIFDIEKWKK